MPNYVQNKITFECPDEKAKEILTAVMYDPDPSNKDSTGYGTIDFNKLIPMPPSLKIECGSSTERGIEMYLSAINPKSSDMGLPKLSANAFRQLVLKLNQERLFSEYRSWLSDSEIAEYTKRETMDNLLQQNNGIKGRFAYCRNTRSDLFSVHTQSACKEGLPEANEMSFGGSR